MRSAVHSASPQVTGGAETLLNYQTAPAPAALLGGTVASQRVSARRGQYWNVVSPVVSSLPRAFFSFSHFFLFFSFSEVSS